MRDLEFHTLNNVKQANSYLNLLAHADCVALRIDVVHNNGKYCLMYLKNHHINRLFISECGYIYIEI